jgi:hypothetical protein
MQVEQLAINIDQQSVLAKLLARENINVIHGAYKTAWFDPKKRTLALPVWKNKGKAVYDLLTGHEVGHALYTPAQGWHDAVDDIKGAPKAYLNILEDVRIERKIQDRYPGLRSQFQKAYKILSDDDFFGLDKLALTGQTLDSLLLIDRINIYYKVGAHIDVKFSAIEQQFVNRANKTSTFAEVVELAKEIYAYQKSLRKKQVKKKMPKLDLPKMDILPEDMPLTQEFDNSQDYDKADPDEVEEQQEEDKSSMKSDTKSDKSDAKESKDEEEETGGNRVSDAKEPEEETKEESKAEETPEKVDGRKEETDSATEGPTEPEPEDQNAYTDDTFRDREGELVADVGNTMIYTAGDFRQKDVVIDFKEYYAHWKTDLARLKGSYTQDVIDSQMLVLDTEYKKFKLDTEMAAAYMAKEFELRKAAFQYSRSTVHKTGLLNTNKLHSYKTSEDIFLRSTKLANYKNHGMMLYIDFSGSMSDNIGATIRQTLNLAAFCRMVNIPYEVYAFTTRVRSLAEVERNDYEDYSDCELVMQKFNLINLMSSRMKRTEHSEAQRMLWNLSRSWDGSLNQGYITPWNHLHSTPLNSCILFAETQIKNFKAKHGIDKMTAMFLSDGDSDSFQVRLDDLGDAHRAGTKTHYRGHRAIVRAMNKTFEVDSVHSYSVTSGLLKTLKQSTSSTVLGFFISEYRNHAINRVLDGRKFASDYSKRKDAYTEQMNKNRAVIEDDIYGYDRYFSLCAKYMDVTEDEFGEIVEDGASKNKLKTAFSKVSKQKRVNRILLNAFVEAIA